MDPRTRDTKLKQDKAQRALLDRAFDRVIGSQLQKLQTSKSSATTNQEEEAYRLRLEQEREAVLKKKPKKTLTKEQEELARSTGLSGHVVALMGASTQETSKRELKKRSKKNERSDLVTVMILQVAAAVVRIAKILPSIEKDDERKRRKGDDEKKRKRNGKKVESDPKRKVLVVIETKKGCNGATE